MSPPFIVSISDVTLARRLGAVDLVFTRKGAELAGLNNFYFMSGSAILEWPVEPIVMAETILAARAASKPNK